MKLILTLVVTLVLIGCGSNPYSCPEKRLWLMTEFLKECTKEKDPETCAATAKQLYCEVIDTKSQQEARDWK
jgi:uncharacterized protein YcfL